MKKYIILIICSILLVFYINLNAYSFNYLNIFKVKAPIYIKTEKLDVINYNWWKNFNDNCLLNMIEKSIEKNHDLKSASLRTEEYREKINQVFSNELPKASIGAYYSGIKLPHISNIKDYQQNGIIMPSIASYEADILLKNHNKTQSERKAYLAKKYQEKSIYISLISDLASCYINLIKTIKQAEIQKEIIHIQEEILNREYKKFNAGVISKYDMNNEKQILLKEKEKLDTYLKNKKILMSELCVFIGESPVNFKDLKFKDFGLFEYNKKIPQEISSDIIFQRPDIIEIEYLLQQSKIDIKVARKELLPKFNIAGIFIFNTFGSGNFFSWESSLASLLAGFTQDLFTGGKKISYLKIKNNKYLQLLEKYYQANLNGIKEVNDALFKIKYDTKIDQEVISEKLIEKDTYNMNLNKYNKGTISYPDLLKVNIKYLKKEQESIDSKTIRLIDYISLYKAVGGEL